MKKLLFTTFFLWVVTGLFAGSFIVNYYIKDVKTEELTTYISSRELTGYVIKQDNYEGVIFCEKISANQDDRYGAALALSISKDLGCRVIQRRIISLS